MRERYEIVQNANAIRVLEKLIADLPRLKQHWAARLEKLRKSAGAPFDAESAPAATHADTASQTPPEVVSLEGVTISDVHKLIDEGRLTAARALELERKTRRPRPNLIQQLEQDTAALRRRQRERRRSMNWINLQVSFVRAPEYVGSKPVERATWLNVLAYCIEHENGGRIAGGALWKDRQWQQAAGVTAREVRAASKLITIEGDDVVVASYPIDKEREVRAKRIQAKDAARTRWDNAPRNAPRIAPCNTSGTAKEKEKEKEKEEGEVENTHEAGVFAFPGNEAALALESARPAKPARPRDVLFEALARAEGSDPLQLTKAGARAIGVALAEIRRASPEVTVSEIQNRAAIYRKVMSHGCTLTAAALAKHWARCSGAPVGKVANEKPAPVPSEWVAWLDENMPASDDSAWSQLTAAKNLQSFTLMPASWQDRCRVELQQSEPALATGAAKHSSARRGGAALHA